MRLCLRRLRYFVLFDETNPKSRPLIYRLPHLGLTLLAAWGIWVCAGGDCRRLAPTVLTVALITVFHVLTIVSARFHIPIEPLLGLWAAHGLASARVVGVRRSTATADHVVRVRVDRGLEGMQLRDLLGHPVASDEVVGGQT